MSLVAFILGYGANIGESVGSFLKEQGYAVAVGSRNPDYDSAKNAGFFPIEVDGGNPTSVKDAFVTVVAELGAPTVIIYNVASFNIPPTPSDPLSLPLEALTAASSIGLGVFTVAQQALPGFRAESAKDLPKAFIVTGNALPFLPPNKPLFIGLGIQKTIEARLIHFLSKAYQKEDIRFYYATLVSSSGGAPLPDLFAASGPIHAKVYWQLINTKDGYWDYRKVVAHLFLLAKAKFCVGLQVTGKSYPIMSNELVKKQITGQCQVNMSMKERGVYRHAELSHQ